MVMTGAYWPHRPPKVVENVILDQVRQPDGCGFLILVPTQGCAMGTATLGLVPVGQLSMAREVHDDIGSEFRSTREVGHNAPKSYVVYGLSPIKLHGA
jgi:hypothetical protein